MEGEWPTRTARSFVFWVGQADEKPEPTATKLNHEGGEIAFGRDCLFFRQHETQVKRCVQNHLYKKGVKGIPVIWPTSDSQRNGCLNTSGST